MLIDCINVKYRNSIENPLNEVENEVLDYLMAQGYSLEIIGAYYFKEMVVSIISKILNFSSLDGEEMNNLIDSINSPYSQFYFDLARNKHDIGITTYNQYIRQALSLKENENTGLKAYQLALEIISDRDKKNNMSPIVRKLEQ